MILVSLLVLSLLSSQVTAQSDAVDQALSRAFGAEQDEGESEEEHFEKEILVIPNHFPKDLNFFCYPRSELQRDRLCFGQLDAFALACADDTPPLQLVPFCLAFRGQCTRVNYPPDEMCKLEKRRYRRFCKGTRKNVCKSCSYDLSCSTEPYEPLWRRHGYETAVWCQRYELFCDRKSRREKGNELVTLMKDAVKVHYRCMHLFNLAQVICDPFRQQFDQQRCMKFLFDCELISEWDEEDESKEADVAKIKESEKLEEKEHHGPPETGKPVGPEAATKAKIAVSPEEEKLAKKIEEEEKLLEKLIEESEKDEKAMKHPNNMTMVSVSDDVILKNETRQIVMDDHPFSKIKLQTAQNETNTP